MNTCLNTRKQKKKMELFGREKKKKKIRRLYIKSNNFLYFTKNQRKNLDWTRVIGRKKNQTRSLRNVMEILAKLTASWSWIRERALNGSGENLENKEKSRRCRDWGVQTHPGITIIDWRKTQKHKKLLVQYEADMMRNHNM